MAKLTLTQVASFFKSEWLLLFLGIVSITIFTLAIVSFSKTKAPGASLGTPWKNNIYAGKTTKEKLEAALGPPLKVEKGASKISFFYPSSNEFRPHEVELSDHTIKIIKEQVIGDERGKLSDYIQQYGQPDIALFGKHGTFAPGHFWGKAGLLVFANKFDGTIVEIWYFVPSTINQFLLENPELKLEEPKKF